MKYLRTFFIALEAEFATRVNIIGWFLVGLIPIIVLIFVWLAIMGDKQSINGFTKGDFIVYYLFLQLSWYIVGGSFGYNVGDAIKKGQINTTLLKPYNIVFSHYIQEQAWKLLSLFIAIPISTIILFLFRDSIHIHLSLQQSTLLAFSLVFGGILFALLEALTGLTAFWLTEIRPVTRLKETVISLFGGMLIPITLMPHALLNLANILPFKYMFYVPISILLGKSTNAFLDVIIQIVYIILFYVLYKFVWSLGIKKYEAVGV